MYFVASFSRHLLGKVESWDKQGIKMFVLMIFAGRVLRVYNTRQKMPKHLSLDRKSLCLKYFFYTFQLLGCVYYYHRTLIIECRYLDRQCTIIGRYADDSCMKPSGKVLPSGEKTLLSQVENLCFEISLSYIITIIKDIFKITPTV